MMIKHLGKEFYVDKRLFQDLSIYVNDVVKHDLDFLMCITGEEGNGKSKLSRQISWIISYLLFTKYNIEIIPTINDLYFDLNDYMKQSMKGGKFKINILDESRGLLNRKSSTSRESKLFTNYLSECRKFNQFHILCLPALHDLDKYCFLWRTRYFVHVKRNRDENYNIVRGWYIVYPKDKRLIFCYESNFYEYPKFNPKKGGFKGNFSNFEAFDEMDKYEEKQKAIMEKKYIVKEKETRDVKMIKKLYASGMTMQQIGDIAGCGRHAISNIVKPKEDG